MPAKANETPVARAASLLLSAADVVWVIDDEESVRDCLLFALRSSYTVRTFSSIEEAQQSLPTETPAVLLSDHYLPGENGLDFLTRLHQSHPGIQRIFMTGRSDVELLARAINEAAVVHFLPKPFDLTSLRSIVQAAHADYRRWLKETKVNAEVTVWQRENQSLVQRTRGRLQRLWQFTLTIALALLALAGLALVLGLTVLLVLYAVKCVFGFDVFENSHLRDWF